MRRVAVATRLGPGAPGSLTQVIGRSVLGSTPFLVLPAFRVEHLVQYPLFLLPQMLAIVLATGVKRPRLT